MANHKALKPKPKPRSRIIFFVIFVTAISLFYLLSSSSNSSSFSTLTLENVVNFNTLKHRNANEKFLYWGNRIDCPGKHCDSCEGLGHQESSLRCALEEAMFLQRTLVMPSRMCINPIHNKKGILHEVNSASSEEMWSASSCAMDSLYDLDLMSETVPVILDNSKMLYQVVSTSMKLGAQGVAPVEKVDWADLNENSYCSNLLLMNRTASPLSW